MNIDYRYIIDPSSLVIESEFLAFQTRFEDAERYVQEEGAADPILLSIPYPFYDELENGEGSLEDSALAKFYANDDDKIATREQILEFIQAHRWDIFEAETEDHPFADQGYHEQVEAVLENLLGMLEQGETWLVAARRKTINAFAKAKRWILETGTEVAENVVSNVLDLEDREDGEDILTARNVAVTLGKFAAFGVLATSAIPLASASSSLIFLIDP